MSFSIWLVPDSEWAKAFTTIAGTLAERFSTPRFDPHLTLLEGRPLDVEAVSRHLGAIASTTPPFTVPIADVATGEMYFRSFYALFELAAPLVDLRERIHTAVLNRRSTEFIPHVSLLYGPVEAAPKALAAAECRAQLQGQRVRFERIEIVRSGNDVPIEDWRSVAVFPLGI